MTDLAECEGCPVLGECCYFKVELGGDQYVTSLPCPYLDLETKRCQRYATRHLVPWCCNVDNVPLPVQCVHHAGLTAHRAASAEAQEAVDLFLRHKLEESTAVQ